MVEMADPHIGLLSFQQALTSRLIEPRPAKFDRKLLMLADAPNGEMRLTYALVDNGTVKATVLFVPAEPYAGEARFSLGYAVAERFRGQGVGTDIVTRSINDFRRGLKSRAFWLEAIVDATNTASRRICEKILTTEAEPMDESNSGRPSFNYLVRVTASDITAAPRA